MLAVKINTHVLAVILMMELWNLANTLQIRGAKVKTKYYRFLPVNKGSQSPEWPVNALILRMVPALCQTELVGSFHAITVERTKLGRRSVA